MKLLLDTHALLWWLADDPRLGAAARSAIADPSRTVLVSDATLFEIAVKIGIGKLRIDIAAMMAAIGERGLDRLGIAQPHLEVLAGLARHHRHPFDHMLIAQAIAEGATLMTADSAFAAYPVTLAACR